MDVSHSEYNMDLIYGWLKTTDLENEEIVMEVNSVAEVVD